MWRRKAQVSGVVGGQVHNRGMPRLTMMLAPPQVRRAARRRGVTKARLADELQTFVEVKPAPGRWKTAAHITTCVTLTVLALSFVLGPQLGLLGLTGTFLCTVSVKRTWRHRVTILACMTLAYVAALTIGVSVAGHAVLTTVALTAIAGVSVLLYHALVGDPPGPVFLTIGPAIGTYLPTVGVPGSRFLLAAGCGAVMSSVLSLALQYPQRHEPEDQAVDEAQEACDAYFESDPDGDFVETGRLRDTAYASIFSAAWALSAATGRRHPDPHWRELTKRLRRLHIEVVQRTAATRLPGAVIAVPVMAQARYLGRPPRRYLLRWGLSRSSLPALIARRAALAVLLTCVLAYALGVTHPYWAVMTTALLISLGDDRLTLTHRAAHRFVGTVVGVGLFFLVSLTHPSGWWVIVVALMCVYLLQWTVVRNYALGSMFITPMALLVASAGTAHKPIGELMLDRIFETALSCVICLFVLWAFGRRLPVLLVRRQFRRALRALERVLLLVADGEHNSERGVSARRDLVFEQLEAAHVLQIAQRDLPRVLGSWSELEASLGSATYVTLAACWTHDPLAHLDANAMASRLARLIHDLPPVSTQLVDATTIAASVDDLLDVGGHGAAPRP